MPALILWLLIAPILGFLASPWFFVTLLLLPRLAAVPLAARKQEYSRVLDRSDGADKTGLLVKMLLGPALVLCIPALILGVLGAHSRFSSSS